MAAPGSTGPSATVKVASALHARGAEAVFAGPGSPARSLYSGPTIQRHPTATRSSSPPSPRAGPRRLRTRRPSPRAPPDRRWRRRPYPTLRGMASPHPRGRAPPDPGGTPSLSHDRLLARGAAPRKAAARAPAPVVHEIALTPTRSGGAQRPAPASRALPAPFAPARRERPPPRYSRCAGGGSELAPRSPPGGADALGGGLAGDRAALVAALRSRMAARERGRAGLARAVGATFSGRRPGSHPTLPEHADSSKRSVCHDRGVLARFALALSSGRRSPARTESSFRG